MAGTIAKEPGAFRKEKVIILAIWFAGLIGVRLLLGTLLALEGTWPATAGSIGIIFAIFYVVLKYTSLSRYSGIVNAALLSWFSKRYFVWGVVSSMVVLSSLIFLVEFGYLYHSAELISYEQFRGISNNDENSIGTVQKLLTSSADTTAASQRPHYGIIDTMSILLASVDRTIGGYYVKAVSFILAEDVELLIFMVLVRRSGEKGLFQSGNASTIQNGN